MRKFTAALAIAGTLGWTAAATAASVTIHSGSVSINGGPPFRGSAQVNPGDTVTAGPNGSATITYGTNCKLPVDSGNTVTVLPDSQCASGFAGFDGTTVIIGAAVVAGAVGIGIAASQGSDDKKKPASP